MSQEIHREGRGRNHATQGFFFPDIAPGSSDRRHGIPGRRVPSKARREREDLRKLPRGLPGQAQASVPPYARKAGGLFRLP